MLKPFRLLRPQSITEASRALRRYGERAHIYAGGSELLILLRRGFIETDYLVDIKAIPELSRLEWDGTQIVIGAAVTHSNLEHSPAVREHMPALATAEGHLANVRVRNVGTLGGNLCFADPHSDPGTLLLVYDTTVSLRLGRRNRRLPLADFFVGTYETVLEPGELLATVEVPALPAGIRAAYQRVERFERPSLGVAAATRYDGGRLHDVRLSVGCVGPKPVRLPELESELEGLTIEEAQQRLREARPALTELLEPVDDIHGKADYKIYLSTILLGRTLAEAAGTNGGASHD